MSSNSPHGPRARPTGVIALATVLALAAPTHAHAQRTATTLRRGAPGAPRGPLTDVTVSLGGTRYTAQVDANCHVDPRATAGGPRAYFVMMYPWFGQRPAPDQPQWHVNLEIRRGAASEASNEFVFSFGDGARAATIQTVAGSQRMGSGTVRVTRHGDGARFEVAGRSHEGEEIHATIDCSAFQKSEGAGG